MKKWLVTLLLGSTLASTAWADLAQNKQEFNAKSQQFVSALNQSVAKMDKNLKALNASEQKIQGYLGQQPTAQEKQCLNAMLTRASGTKKLVTVMRQQLVSVQKQIPVLQKSAMAAQSAAQLNQAADKANALVQGLNATGEKNSQMAEQWTAKVEQACAGME